MDHDDDQCFDHLYPYFFLIEQLFILFLLKQISHLLLGAPLSIR